MPEEGAERSVPCADLVLQNVHRTLYSQDLPVRAFVLDLRHRGFQEVGADKGVVPHRMADSALQPVGRQRVRSGTVALS